MLVDKEHVHYYSTAGQDSDFVHEEEASRLLTEKTEVAAEFDRVAGQQANGGTLVPWRIGWVYDKGAWQ